MKKIIIVFVCCIFLMGCGSSSNNVNTTVDAETKTDEYVIYPASIQSTLYDYATNAPNIIYTTPSSENGLSGCAYCVSGTIIDVVSLEDSFYGMRYFVVENENGMIYFFDFMDSQFPSTTTTEEKELVQTMYGSGYDNTFPQKNEKATVYGLYFGYSNVLNGPTFFFGLNENVQKLLFSETEAHDKEKINEVVETDNTEIPTSIPVTTASPDPTSVSEAIVSPTSVSDTPPTSEAEIANSNSACVTSEQKNALNQSKRYLKVSAFSYQGLIDQLEYENYNHDASVYAVDNCGADWNEQALIKAKSYLDISAFSYQGLIDQLEYEKFTNEQAVYGVNNCGADWNEQAANKAAYYLNFSSFSREELISQLKYEGFTDDQAIYGVQANGY